MSTEVKIVYADVEERVGEMSSAAESLNPQAEPPITGNMLMSLRNLPSCLRKKNNF